MAIKRTRVVVPTTAALADGDRLPSTSPAVIRTLSKISRPALLSLVLEWLSDDYQPICAPYLVEREEDDEGVLYPAARSVEDLREFYQELQARKGVKKEVVDRVVEGDWVRVGRSKGILQRGMSGICAQRGRADDSIRRGTE